MPGATGVSINKIYVIQWREHCLEENGGREVNLTLLWNI